jgi:hypothetical protein
MHRLKRSSIGILATGGIAAGALFILMGIPLTTAPASAVVYCQYIGYPQGCVARAGVVLRPRPVARATVRAGTASPTNINGGVNRIGVRR